MPSAPIEPPIAQRSQRRRATIAALALALALAMPASAGEIRLLIQSSPLAGSQYYDAEELKDRIRIGDALTLVREPDNPHDANAIRVEWRGRKLGYVPRAENRALAAAIDSGERVVARVKTLQAHPKPWRRIEFEVFLVL